MVSVLPVTQTITQTQTLPQTLTPSMQEVVATKNDVSETPMAPTATRTPEPTATETPPPPTNCPPPAGWLAIQTAPGDTLDSLAFTYGTSVEDLMVANCLVITQVIPGTRLYVPPFKSPTPTDRCTPPAGWIQYTVQPGDTLYRLSLMFRVSISQLQTVNCLTSTRIQIGQRLYVPNMPTWTPVVLSPTPTLTLTFTRTPTPTKIIIPTTAVPTATNLPTTAPTPLPSSTPTFTPTNTPTPTTPAPTDTDTPIPSPSAGSGFLEQNLYP